MSIPRRMEVEFQDGTVLDISKYLVPAQNDRNTLLPLAQNKEINLSGGIY